MPEHTNPPPDARPTIFLLEEDDDVQRPLKANLRKRGYRVLLAVDLEDAFDWLSTGHIPADLVLVDLVRKFPAEALEVGRKLRAHARYDGHTPLVVLAEKFGAELAGTDDNVGGNDWVAYMEDSDQLQRLLSRLTKKDSARQT